MKDSCDEEDLILLSLDLKGLKQKYRNKHPDMEFLILFQLGGHRIALFLKRLIPFVVTQKGFFPLDFSSMWLLQESAEKDS